MNNLCSWKAAVLVGWHTLSVLMAACFPLCKDRFSVHFPVNTSAGFFQCGGLQGGESFSSLFHTICSNVYLI